MHSTTNVTLIYSGGMDSTVLLYLYKESGRRVVALSFNYGQRHSRELESAKTICELTGTEHHVLTLPTLRGPTVTGGVAIPHGHYEEESMKAIVCPNRNMIMLAYAANFAIDRDCSAVAYGCHGGDHAIYPDCRPEFVEVMRQALRICDWHPLELLTPFLTMTKRDIANIGKRLNVPFELTWTCYEGGNEPCGKCGSCVERTEALA